MTAPGFPFDTNVLVKVVPSLKIAQNFLLDRFFPEVINFETEFVSIDVEIGKRRMSPFVSPLVQGKMVESLRTQTNVFKPAYVKDKRAPDLRQPIRRSIGEQIGGTMSGAQREMANIAYQMTDQINMLNRRLEWMASQVLQTGTVTIKGDGYPSTMVDFGRDPLLTKVLTSGATWTPANVIAGTASPTSDLESWQTQLLKSSGVVVTDVVFTPLAWAGFIASPLVKAAIEFPRLLITSANQQVDITPQGAVGAVTKGRWGQFNLFLYNDWFVDDNNVEQPMIVDGTVILSGSQMMGTRAFGQILDPKFNYQPMSYAPKTWLEEDPAQRYLMMQSSPIVVPVRANGALSAKVV